MRPWHGSDGHSWFMLVHVGSLISPSVGRLDMAQDVPFRFQILIDPAVEPQVPSCSKLQQSNGTIGSIGTGGT